MGSTGKPRPEPAGEADLVRCLACGTVYAKPVSVNAPGADANCPNCAHVGWLALALPDGPPVSPGPRW